ncbi:MAG: hypothetical protein ACYCOU_05070 [Sulfobacillus sp.]
MTVEEIKQQGRQYKPTINIGQAPHMVVPMLYIGSAYLFLLLAAIVLFTHAADVALSDFSLPIVITMVHLFTLGFLSMTAMGVLSQWVPVVFDVDPVGRRRGVVQYMVYALGFMLFAWGFSHELWVLVAIGGAFLALAIVLWSNNVLGQLKRSKKSRDAMFYGIVGAVLGFNITWLLGLSMAFSFVGWWPFLDILRIHVATALTAWIGLLLLSVQLKLNPMFSMSKLDRVRPAIPMILTVLGLLAAWGSAVEPLLFRLSGVLWAAAVAVSIVQSGLVIGRGKSPRLDSVFLGVMASWLLLLGAAFFAVVPSPLAVVLALWGTMGLILSYQARIIPFMLALAVAKRLPGPPAKAFFIAQTMHSRIQPVLIAGLMLLGGAVSVWGISRRSSLAIEGAAFIVLLVVLSQFVNLGISVNRGRRQKHPVTGILPKN